MANPDENPKTADSEILNGIPIFTGTRVPVSALLENIDAGVTIEEFLENFPTVDRDQVMRILETDEFHHNLAIANEVMSDDRELLSRLAKS